MNKITCAIVLLLTATLATRAQSTETDPHGYVKYDAAMHYLTLNLRLADIDQTQRYRLGKKPDGWHVYVIDYLPDSTGEKQDRLCWSKTTGEYMPVGHAENDDDVAEIKKQLTVTGFTNDDFYRMPCYGYAGWYDDVIAKLKDSTKLCDLNQFALGRAYAYKSFAMVSPSVTYSHPKENFRLADKENAMSPQQLQEYRKYAELSFVENYKLWQQNPFYETYIGCSNTQYSNEVITQYLNVATCQNLAEAEKDLRKNLYEPFLLAFAKNLLNSCEPNAILITQGDNDTYPLYYAQTVLGYRRDVLVVNASLLATSRYINFLRRGVYDAPPLPFNLKPDEYTGSKLDFLNSTDKDFKKLIKVTGLDFTPSVTTLYKNDIAILDMIAANHWKRPINFSQSVAPAVLLGMEKYLLLEGLSYRLYPKKKSEAQAPWNAPPNTSFFLDFAKTKMEATDWKNQHLPDENVRWITPNCRTAFLRTCDALIADKKPKEARELLDRCFQLFPDSLIPLDVFTYNLPELYFKCDDKKMADKTATTLMNNSIALFERSFANSKLKLDEWNRAMRESLFTLQEVLSFYKKEFADNALTEKLEEAFTKRRQAYADELERREKQ